jgi:hypothetical protein
MKTKHFISALFISFVAFSCTPESTSTVTGFWTATSIHVNSVDVMNTAPYFTNVKQDIQSDHTFIAYSDYDTATGTWQSTSTQLTIYMPTDTFVYDYHLPDNSHLHMSTTIFGNFSEYEFQK